MEKIQFATTDKKKVALYVWDKAVSPKLIVQLVHGMCEHSSRYAEFAEFLNENGIIAAMNDQRGHGESAADAASYGYDDGNMWDNNISDQLGISRFLQTKYDLPLVLFGHSYGSFLVQRLMQIDPIPVAFVLSGSCYMNTPTVKLGAALSAQKARKSPGAPGALMAKMSFKQYEKRFPGLNNWLSSDPETVKKYNDDPACGYVASNSFYASFMNGLKTVYKRANRNSININRPVYIMSGSDDPVSNYGKGVQKLHDYFVDYGVRDVTLKIYQGGRHEMLNETNKAEVYGDVLGFLKRFKKLD